MAKKQVSISSFKLGLDTRREQLVSAPGTLQTAQDGHITMGGDFEKRKAFLEQYDVSVLDTNGDQGTFGIQDTINGLYVFGSAIVFGGSVTLSQPTLVSAMPSGVTYQQLKHPAIYDQTTYDRTKYRMTKVVCSESFGGLPQVIAEFADGNRYMYYNGDIVEDVNMGLRMAHLNTNPLLAANLKRVITALGNQFTAAYTPGNAYVDVSGPVGLEFNTLVNTDLETGSTGVLSSTDTVDAVNTIPGVAAKAKFRVIAGEDSVAASSTLTNDGTIPANNSTVTVGGITYTWKTAIANNHDVLIGATNDTAMQNLIYAINYTGTPGTNYVGTAPNPLVKVTAAYNSGANTFVVVARTAGTAGNSIATTTAGTSHVTWTGATLSGGANTNAITDIKVGAFSIFDTTTPIIWNQDAQTTVKAVVAAINSYASSEYTAVADNDAVVITAPVVGAAQNGVGISVTTTGQICIGNLQAAFVVGGAGFTINNFNVDAVDVKGTLSAGNATAGYATLELFCQALADAIYAGVGTHGLTAVARGNVVYVSKQITTSEDQALNAYVTITPAGGTANGSGVTLNNVAQPGAFLVSITPSTNVTKTGTPGPGSGGWVISTDYVTASPYFGTGPYIYNWTKIDGSEFVNFWLQGLNTTFFYLNVGLIFLKGTYTARFKCVVTDGLGAVSTSDNIVVTINYI